jgi:hypothetical protein
VWWRFFHFSKSKVRSPEGRALSPEGLCLIQTLSPSAKTGPQDDIRLFFEERHGRVEGVLLFNGRAKDKRSRPSYCGEEGPAQRDIRCPKHESNSSFSATATTDSSSWKISAAAIWPRIFAVHLLHVKVLGRKRRPAATLRGGLHVSFVGGIAAPLAQALPESC